MLTACLGATAVSHAAVTTLHVLSAGAMHAGVAPLVAAYAQRTGTRVDIRYVPVGEIEQRLQRGAPPDLLIVTADAADRYIAKGQARKRSDLAEIGVGVAVRSGAPVPDISTAAAFKQSMLAARSITFMDPSKGTSGKYLTGLFDSLGIGREIMAKTTLGDGGYVATAVADGKIEIALQQMSELAPVKGITLVGPLPDALQKWTIYSAVIPDKSAAPAQAQELVDILTSSAARGQLAKEGYRLVP